MEAKDDIVVGGLPPGYRFKPTDEELIDHYLMNKASCRAFQGQAFQDIDASELYSKPPKSLVTFPNGEREWYFFIREDENFPFATKRYLTYFSGSLSEAKKTHWTMEEYRLHVINGCIIKQNIKPKEWVLGRITRGREYKSCF
ncbi:hypothetical protein SLA2020_443920 [Shorea laevis]